MSEPFEGRIEAAVNQLQRGNAGEAERQLLALLAETPGHADVLHLLGIIAYQRDDYALAVGYLEQAVFAGPNVPPFIFNHANALKSAGRIEEAKSAYQRVLDLDPCFIPARRALALLSAEGAHWAQALQHYLTLLESQSANDEDWPAAGEVALGAGQPALAIRMLERATSLFPENRRIWNNLGVAYSQSGRLSEGMVAFQRAATGVEPYPQAVGNYANALKDAGRQDDALLQYEIALAQSPSDSDMRSNALLAALYSDRVTPEALFDAHCQFESHLPDCGIEVAAQRPLFSSSRLRIGYLSPDFRNHPVAYFMADLVKHHDRDRFDIFLYSAAPFHDAWSDRLRSGNVMWRDVYAIGDRQLRTMIHDDGIDVLVDLAGHTAHNRAPALATRLAPVQVSYLGYPFSTGLSAMDWRLTDHHVDPVGEDLASEQLFRLSRSYYAYASPDNAPEVSPLPQLKNGFVTFGVCSNLAKVCRLTLDRWAEALHAVPGSRMRWRAKAFADSDTRDHMIWQLTERGIAQERLAMLPWAPEGTRWEVFASIDLALDTFPYNQATNTCEALWMGVPTLTCAGGTHQARMGASILHSAGLDDFVAPTSEQWVQLATTWASDAHRLSLLRSSMRDRLRCSPLFDTCGLVREIEAFYSDVAKR